MSRPAAVRRCDLAAVLLLASMVALPGCVARPVLPSESRAPTVRTEPTAPSQASPSGVRPPRASGSAASSPPAQAASGPPASSASIVVSIPSTFGSLRVRVAGDGVIAAGRAATASEVARIDLGVTNIGVRNLAPDRLLVAWIGSVCDRSALLTVSPTTLFLAPNPRPGCDAQAIGWGVVLTSDAQFDASGMSANEGGTVLLP
jgi:hypothetical protein